MNKIYGILLIGLLLFGCREKNSKNDNSENKVEYNQELVDELSKMYSIDQLAAAYANPPENYSHLSQEEWIAFKDSVYTTHQNRVKENI